MLALLESSRPWGRAVDLSEDWQVCAEHVPWRHQKAQEISIWTLCFFMFSSLSHLSHFSTFENVHSRAAAWKKTTFILITGSSVWDWGSDWNLVGWTSALGLLWNRLIWYHSQRDEKMTQNHNVLNCNLLVLLMRWDIVFSCWMML